MCRVFVKSPFEIHYVRTMKQKHNNKLTNNPTPTERNCSLVFHPKLIPFSLSLFHSLGASHSLTVSFSFICLFTFVWFLSLRANTFCEIKWKFYGFTRIFMNFPNQNHMYTSRTQSSKPELLSLPVPNDLCNGFIYF